VILSERDVRSMVSWARSALAPQPADSTGRAGEFVAPEHESLPSLWRSVLRRLPRDLEYVPPDDVIDENLKCPVCLCWPSEPVHVGCPAGHMLCRACASDLRTCPLDRQPFASTSPAPQAVLTRLDRLQVRCPFAAAGCGWTGDRGSLMNHCGTCDSALEECRQCGAHVRRRERAAHIHSFEVGACVELLSDRDAGVGEVLRTDTISDFAMVRFPTGVRACHRRELKQAAVRPPHEVAAERRQAQIDSVLGVYEQAERLNVCFLVDCTGSMSPHIHAVRHQIFRIVREMSLRISSMQLHVSFVGYRDHGDSVRLEVFPFSTSVNDFRSFVSKVGAWGCGGDIPEDVIGGLDQVLALDWGIGGAATRVLLHIGDAPCHGKHYQSDGRFKDNYPDGDPTGLQPSELLRRLKEQDVQYVFGRINASTDHMIRLFDEHAGGNYIQTREMRNTAQLAEIVTTSLHASVSATVTALSSGGRAPNRVETSDEVPYWGDIGAQNVQLRRCVRVESLADLRRGAPVSATRRFEVDSARVKLARLPFSQGETRAARHALLESHGNQRAVAKHMKVVAPAVDDEVDDLGADVEEEADNSCDVDDLLTLSEVSAVAVFLAEQFSAERERGSKIRFLESHVAVPLDGGKPFNLELALPADEFRRFSNNIGWWERDADELLMAFMRWTFEATEGYMMVVDLQGVRTDEGFELTDPCILCADVTRFGSGNLGPRALQRCMASLATHLDEPIEEEEEVVPPPGAAPPVPLPVPPFVPTKLSWGDGPGTPVACEVERPPDPGADAPNVAASAISRASAAVSAAFRKVDMRPRSKATSLDNSSGTASAGGEDAVEVLDVDALIAGLLVPSKSAKLAKMPCEQDIKLLLIAARGVLMAQPSLLELEAPLNILGDIHGQFPDLLRHLEAGGGVETSSYLFLGDYVDRGKQSLAVMTLLLALKVKRPENMFLLRGNHECASITRIYGFYDECKRHFNVKLWKAFCNVFNTLPLAAVVDEKIFCCHGGLSPELHHFDAVRRIQRPIDVPDSGLVCDLLWADPDTDVAGWHENNRGVSYVFGADAVVSFLQKHDLDLIVRAHQVVEDGYEFFAARRLVTMFSAPNYCGEFDNAGALMKVRDDLSCSFKLVR